MDLTTTSPEVIVHDPSAAGAFITASYSHLLRNRTKPAPVPACAVPQTGCPDIDALLGTVRVSRTRGTLAPAARRLFWHLGVAGGVVDWVDQSLTIEFITGLAIFLLVAMYCH